MVTENTVLGKTWGEWEEAFPIVAEIRALRETGWQNREKRSSKEAIANCELTMADVLDANKRLERFAPYFEAVFPETASMGGIIESPIREIPQMKNVLEAQEQRGLPGKLWLKLDSHLPISGSIKARGGIYEILKTAEEIAIRTCFHDFKLGKCSDEMLEEYKKINKQYWQRLECGEISKKEVLEGRFRDFFSCYGIDLAIVSRF